MIGIVGNLVFEYEYKGASLTAAVNPADAEKVSLGGGEVTLAIEEVTYIEDTVYGVSLSYLDNEWYVSGNEPKPFEICDMDIRGTVRLDFTHK